MNDPKTDLISKYLDGCADADEVERLEQTFANEPDAVDELLSHAYMDVHLRETLSGNALGESIGQILQQSKPVAGRIGPRRWVAAAVLLATISGWAFALYVGSKLGEANINVEKLKNRVTDLEKDASSPPITIAENDAPEIHSTRGWLMALPQIGGTEGQTLLTGTTAPLDQRLWTCPWGAAEFRYDSGASISIERNTTVTFNELDDLRQLTLERGIVHVTDLSDDKRTTEIKCALATVRLVSAQVAVQVDERRTAVETAINQVEVLVDEEGVIRTFTVERGYYLIIKPGEKAMVIEGMLKLGLEPPGQ
jgi:hypothetical protein